MFLKHARGIVLPGTMSALTLAGGGAASGQQLLHTSVGDGVNDTYGRVVDILGDVNGDGYADFMAGAWRDDNNGMDSGSVRVVSGKTGLTLWTFNGDLADDHMGWGSSAAGDVDGDGFADIAAAADEADVGSVSNAGTVKIFSGQTRTLIWRFDGTSVLELVGWSTGRVGDVNADGKEDVIVGALFGDAPGKANCGTATVVDGSTGLTLHHVAGDTAGDRLGHSCYGAGDVNLDGVPDFIAGAPADDNNGTSCGSARVYSGLTGLPLRTFFGDNAGDELGQSVAGAGDVNLDGHSDLIAGAHLDDNMGSSSGMARVYSGKTYQTLATLNGDAANDRLGTCVCGAGDVNGDGHPDFCAGAPGADSNGLDSGSLRVYSGKDFSILATLDGATATDAFGASCGGGGDVNGDGFFDVVVGAPDDDLGGIQAGTARVYSLVPPGITHWGTGTPGCAGIQLVNGNSVPKVNSPGFTIVANRMPPNALNLLVASDGHNATGGDPFGIGVVFYIDFLGASFVSGFDLMSDHHGNGAVNVPIPNTPALAGTVVAIQNLSAWPAPCGPGPFGLSTSLAALATIQP